VSIAFTQDNISSSDSTRIFTGFLSGTMILQCRVSLIITTQVKMNALLDTVFIIGEFFFCDLSDGRQLDGTQQRQCTILRLRKERYLFIFTHYPTNSPLGYVHFCYRV
jgi:hypothetical protein